MVESLWQKCEFFVTDTNRVEICKNIDDFGQLLDFLLTKDPPGCILGLILPAYTSERSHYVYH